MSPGQLWRLPIRAELDALDVPLRRDVDAFDARAGKRDAVFRLAAVETRLLFVAMNHPEFSWLGQLIVLA